MRTESVRQALSVSHLLGHLERQGGKSISLRAVVKALDQRGSWKNIKPEERRAGVSQPVPVSPY